MYTTPQEQRILYTTLDDNGLGLSLGEASTWDNFEDDFKEAFYYLMPKDPTNMICHLTNFEKNAGKFLIDLEYTIPNREVKRI